MFVNILPNGEKIDFPRQTYDSSMDFYSNTLEKFADQLVWWKTGKESLADQNSFLLHIMAHGSALAYYHSKKEFGFSNTDFIDALKNAKPGIIRNEKEWNDWNELLGVNPALPFPIKYKNWWPPHGIKETEAGPVTSK